MEKFLYFAGTALNIYRKVIYLCKHMLQAEEV
jgi:hypothetical protein